MDTEGFRRFLRERHFPPERVEAFANFAERPRARVRPRRQTDPDQKRYHYCHCPRVKESLSAGRSNISPVFCNCSAAYMKKQ